MQKLMIICTALCIVLGWQGTKAQPRGGLISRPKGASIAAAFTALPKTNSLSATNAPVAEGSVLGFDKLSDFPFVMTDELESPTNTVAATAADERINAMIPKRVHDFDGHKFTVEGFMIPLSFSGNKVVEFILARDPMGCCYGGIPQVHQFVKIRVKPPGVPMVDYSSIEVHGTLRVGPDRRHGELTSIYRMDADKVDTGLDK